MESKLLKVIQPDENPPHPIALRPPPKKIKIGQVQLNTSFSNQYYFPLAVGMNQAYAQRYFSFPEFLEFKTPIYKFMRIEEASERLSDSDIVAISTYIWNGQNALAIAKDCKRRNPNIITIFGGPQVPDSKKQFRRNKSVELNPDELRRERIHFTEDFHRTYDFIDICVHGEGERVFRHILEQYTIDGLRDKSRIPSISYLGQDGKFYYNNKLERMKNKELAETPSPFVAGVFDSLINEDPDQNWIVIYETNRGCPFTCAYCDWGGATEDRVSQFPMEQIYSDIMWMGEHRIPAVWLCDANFGILPRDIQVAEFFAECKAKYGSLEVVTTQNTKNPKRHTIEALKVLERAGLNKVTVMATQSQNPATLIAVRRENMDLSEYDAMQKELNGAGIYTYTDLIVGMPEETYESIVEATSTLIANGQHNRIKFNILTVLKNTEMANPEYQKQYGMRLARTMIVSIHGKKNDSISGIDEYQDIVVATRTTPPDMWVKTVIFGWSTGLYHFNKILQVPTIILHTLYGVSYGDILKLLAEDFDKFGKFPIFEKIRALFTKAALDMRQGSPEYIHAPEWLDIWWPPEEYALIKLCIENDLDNFYIEARELLSKYLSEKGIEFNPEILDDAILLNKSLLKVPFQTEDLYLYLKYNIWEIYKAVLTGREVRLEKDLFEYFIDRKTKTNHANTNCRWDSWEEWCEKMVWWGNRRGAYLYECKPQDT